MAIDVASNADIIQPKQGGDITYMDMVDEREALGASQIQQLFANTTILITGGTGFLGKLLIEKLLRSCPELNKIYLIARPKKNKNTAKRLEEQFDDVLYDKLRKQQPDFVSKVRVLEGDVGQRRLGLRDDDRRTVMDEVEIIFHGAATVRFDEALKTAVEINVRGTRELLTLARGCGRLRALLHVSTAYSNCTLREIEEKFYEPQVSGDQLIDMVESLDEKVLNNITTGLLGEYPNTYVFTKAAAEDVVLRHGRGLPLAVLRPAIVIGTASEPISGWIDNIYGPTGVVVGAAVGLLHVLRCRPAAVADLVPGDMVVNAAIAAAWATARRRPRNLQAAPGDAPPPVYNYVSSAQNPLTWAAFMDYNESYGLRVPTVQAVWYYLLVLTPSAARAALYAGLLHWLPAYLVDFAATCVGKKPMLKKAYLKIGKFSDVMSYFSLRSWKFHNDNVQKLSRSLCAADRHVFDLDVGAVDWSEYFDSYVRGIRVYLLKDPLDSVPAGLRRHRKLKFMHYLVSGVAVFLLLRLLWGIFSFMLGF